MNTDLSGNNSVSILSASLKRPSESRSAVVSRSYRGIFPRQTESTARHLFRSSACPRVNVCVCLSVCGLVWDLLNYHSQIQDITVTRILSGENQTLEESSCHFNRTFPKTNYLTSTPPPPSIPSLIWLARKFW